MEACTARHQVQDWVRKGSCAKTCKEKQRLTPKSVGQSTGNWNQRDLKQQRDITGNQRLSPGETGMILDRKSVV